MLPAVILLLVLMADATTNWKQPLDTRLQPTGTEAGSKRTANDSVSDKQLLHTATVGKLSLSDGRQATLVEYEKLLVKDTKLPSYIEITLRQISDGNRVVQAALGPFGNIIDCDISDAQSAVNRFSNEFSDLRLKLKPENVSLVPRRVFSRSLRRLVNVDGLVRSCYDYQRQRLASAGKVQVRKEPHRERSKRSVIFPGTKWCGKGDEATNYTTLGNSANTDRCCRMHDHCPYTIVGFTQKYGIFNYRFHTVSHCDCDYSFRTCLKTAGSGAANMIGTIYFNVIRLPCFVFVPKLTCVERTWWGKCLTSAHKYVAEIQEALDYNSHV